MLAEDSKASAQPATTETSRSRPIPRFRTSCAPLWYLSVLDRRASHAVSGSHGCSRRRRVCAVPGRVPQKRPVKKSKPLLLLRYSSLKSTLLHLYSLPSVRRARRGPRHPRNDFTACRPTGSKERVPPHYRVLTTERGRGGGHKYVDIIKRGTKRYTVRNVEKRTKEK